MSTPKPDERWEFSGVVEVHGDRQTDTRFVDLRVCAIVRVCAKISARPVGLPRWVVVDSLSCMYMYMFYTIWCAYAGVSLPRLCCRDEIVNGFIACA
jgi:hypothetical protein